MKIQGGAYAPPCHPSWAPMYSHNSLASIYFKKSGSRRQYTAEENS